MLSGSQLEPEYATWQPFLFFWEKIIMLKKNLAFFCVCGGRTSHKLQLDILFLIPLWTSKLNDKSQFGNWSYKKNHTLTLAQNHSGKRKTWGRMKFSIPHLLNLWNTPSSFSVIHRIKAQNQAASFRHPAHFGCGYSGVIGYTHVDLCALYYFYRPKNEVVF